MSTFFTWKNKCLLFQPKGQYSWINSHAQVPTAYIDTDKRLLRVYFATRPKPGLSLTTFVELDYENPAKEIFLHPKSILELGGDGDFDEHGIMPSSIVNQAGIIYLYYSGWSRKSQHPYANFTGLALSEDGGKTFKKIGLNPILDKEVWGPYSATSPHVLIHENVWYMFYCSGIDWIEINGRLEHTYEIKIAISHDGIKWEKTGKTAVSQRNIHEAITRPSIYFDGKTFHMWFCFRGSKDFRNGYDSYKIGYARSQDLLEWKRLDFNSNLNGTGNWDDKMQAYPNVQKLGDKLWMFYNGNGFGSKGFGAVTAQLLN